MNRGQREGYTPLPPTQCWGTRALWSFFTLPPNIESGAWGAHHRNPPQILKNTLQNPTKPTLSQYKTQPRPILCNQHPQKGPHLSPTIRQTPYLKEHYLISKFPQTAAKTPLFWTIFKKHPRIKHQPLDSPQSTPTKSQATLAFCANPDTRGCDSPLAPQEADWARPLI